jgi:hypothetical protein
MTTARDWRAESWSIGVFKLRTIYATSALAAVSLAAALALLIPSARGAPPCPLVASLNPDGIPSDVCPHTAQTLQAFHDMAWQTFKMLVWPAAAGARGVPDTARAVTDMSGPRVFETYKADWETLLAHSAQPLDWNNYPSTVSACSNNPPLTPGVPVLASLHEFGNVREPDFAGLTHVLIAQNGSLVRYAAGFDPLEFKLIRDNQLYITPNLPPLGDGPPSTKTRAPNDAIIIKSAWISMTPPPPNPITFFTRQAWLQDPVTLTCTLTEVGLVGLHIVHKTQSSPQWIWASFEHVQNAPTRGVPLSPPYMFNDGTSTPMPSSPPLNARIPLPGGVVPPPFNVERLRAIANNTKAVNASWQGLLNVVGSVWANYELVLTEWPGIPSNPTRTGLQAEPTPPCLANPNTNLANAVIETFIQPSIACTQPTTCMGCHGRARTSDFVWTLPLNKNGQEEERVFLKYRFVGLSILRAITGWSEREKDHDRR